MFRFPYGNIHELNLDWLLQEMVELKKQTEDYDSAAVGDTVDRLLVALRALRDQQR